MYRLLYWGPGGWETLLSPTASSAIHFGNTPNHLKVTGNGTETTLAVNGIELGVINDNRISGLTGAGIASRPYNNRSESDARFDNFSMAYWSADGGSLIRINGLAESESRAPTSRNLVPSYGVLDWESYSSE